MDDEVARRLGVFASILLVILTTIAAVLLWWRVRDARRSPSVASRGSTAPSCTPGVQTPCATGRPGICASGLATCSRDGRLGACLPTAPVEERCVNTVDDDCDGSTDEDECRPYIRCYAGDMDICDFPLPEIGWSVVGFAVCAPDGSDWGPCAVSSPEAIGDCDPLEVYGCVMPNERTGVMQCREDGTGFTPCAAVSVPRR